MRRVIDVLCGVLIGAGIFGLYACFVEERFDLGDKMYYFLVMLFGGVLTMIELD